MKNKTNNNKKRYIYWLDYPQTDAITGRVTGFTQGTKKVYLAKSKKDAVSELTYKYIRGNTNALHVRRESLFAILLRKLRK